MNNRGIISIIILSMLIASISIGLNMFENTFTLGEVINKELDSINSLIWVENKINLLLYERIYRETLKSSLLNDFNRQFFNYEKPDTSGNISFKNEDLHNDDLVKHIRYRLDETVENNIIRIFSTSDIFGVRQTIERQISFMNPIFLKDIDENNINKYMSLTKELIEGSNNTYVPSKNWDYSVNSHLIKGICLSPMEDYILALEDESYRYFDKGEISIIMRGEGSYLVLEDRDEYGGLSLEGNLYIDGDLYIDTDVLFSGIVIVNGSIIISEGATLQVNGLLRSNNITGDPVYTYDFKEIWNYVKYFPGFIDFKILERE